MKTPTRFAYAKESAMYPDVCGWLRGILRARFPKTPLHVADTSRVTLANHLERESLAEFFPDYQTYEINVDVSGIVQTRKPTLAFVECKITRLSLRDVGQLLGYSQVAQPILSMLLSPAGISQALGLLLKVYRRYTVLEYGDGYRLRVATWDSVRKTVDPATVIPSGNYF